MNDVFCSFTKLSPFLFYILLNDYDYSKMIPICNLQHASSITLIIIIKN